MLRVTEKHDYYRALIAKQPEYEGVFYVGVKTTGIFCRPTCPARKPKFENCEFYRTAQEALAASYRPCKRCRPLSPLSHVNQTVQTLVEAVEAEPEKRWHEPDVRALSVDVSTARRGFKKRFGMTFSAYVRARRLGLAVTQIRGGESVISAQLASGYESGSGFREAFSRVLGAAPSQHRGLVLRAAWLDTPLGPMLAVASEDALYLLEFTDRRGLEHELEHLRLKTGSVVVPGRTRPIIMVERELTGYFEGNLETFSTPVEILGSPFQRGVWRVLGEIPYGETRSYAEVAAAVGRPSAIRAAARASGANLLALIVPCHRVIRADRTPGGYGGGVTRKRWLLEHEKLQGAEDDKSKLRPTV